MKPCVSCTSQIVFPKQNLHSFVKKALRMHDDVMNSDKHLYKMKFSIAIAASLVLTILFTYLFVFL